MKALSIQQPWAYAILRLGKPVENRTWPTNFRGRFQIHAGKKIDKDGLLWLKEQGFDVPEVLPTGGYVGEADLVECAELIDTAEGGVWNSRWAFGPFCFLLRNVTAYPEIVPGQGKLGFFDSDNAGSCLE